MNYQSIITVFLLATGGLTAGAAQVATQIRQEYEAAMRGWAMRLQTAVGPEAREAAAKSRPDAEEYGHRMWTELSGSLRSEWTLEFTPWLLEVVPGLMIDTKGGALKRSPLQEIMREVELMHLKSPGIGRFCIAMAAYEDPASLALVEKIEKENPDEKVQGQAAIAQAILLRSMGDGREVMLKRKEAVRRAIKLSWDVKVGDTTVGELAMDESYIVKNLIVGREGPKVSGKDIAGVPLELKSFRGKIVVLAFWHSGSPDAQQAIDLLTKLRTQNLGRPVELLGVSRDSNETLRELKAKGVLPWRNFADADGKVSEDYRVRQVPQVYVLDEKGIIRFIGKPGSFVELAVEDLVTTMK